MPFASQYQRIILAVIIGIILGVILSFAFSNWFWLPLMIGVCFIVSFFCNSASELPEEKQSNMGVQVSSSILVFSGYMRLFSRSLYR